MTGYDRSLWLWYALGWAVYTGLHYYLKRVKRMTSAFKNGKIKEYIKRVKLYEKGIILAGGSWYTFVSIDPKLRQNSSCRFMITHDLLSAAYANGNKDILIISTPTDLPGFGGFCWVTQFEFGIKPLC